MKEDNTVINNLHNLLDFDARKFISAEVELKNKLPGWITMAGSLKLKSVLQKYLDCVQQHVQKMEAFYEAEKIISVNLANRIMLAFIAEADEKLTYCKETAISDACLLANIQSINHFKISAYGTAAAFANALNMQKQAALFHEAEINEKKIDDRLSQLAEHEININAKTAVLLHV
jgi:ferritin-like metal-binding protein YciE